MSTQLRNKAAIVGVGESDIGKVPHMTGLGLNAQAAKRALDDAGLQVSDIDGLLTAYSFTEPYFMLGTVLCEYLGLKPRYCSAMIAGGATPAVMLGHAAAAIATGMASVVLVCTGENRATGMTRDAAVSALAAAVGHPYFEAPYGPSIPGCYAMITQRYMHEYGITREQLAQVAVTTRRHASLHPNSHMKRPITVEDVIGSKEIAAPLNILDCCLISDAAGAFIVTSAERARDCKGKPAYLLGVGERHTHEHILCAESLVHFGAADSGQAAYEMAGLRPEDIDVAQLYDCFSIVPVIELEELGFCKPGEGGAFYAEGHADIGGKLPVNTHGGMLSHAHAGATGGLLGIVEAVCQLRGGLGERQVEGAEVALVHNEGGVLSSHCTVILSQTARADPYKETQMTAKSRGLYWEDFEVGQILVTPKRTITSTDIVNFACLSGDFNEVHTNWEYAKTTQFGEPIAHGPLVYAIMGGLQYASGVNDGTLLALLQVDKWRMLAPVKHGDTLHMESTVIEKKESSKPDRGVVKFRRRFMKHDGTAVQEMETTLLYRRRTGTEA